MTALTDNPIDNDDRLKGLLSEISAVKSRKAYGIWQKKFLKIYTKYLDKNGILNGKDANYRLLKQLETLDHRIQSVQKPLEENNDNDNDNDTLKTFLQTANGKRLLTNLTQEVVATETKVQELLPKTASDEETFGFDKFELSAVLLEDAFYGYDKMKASRRTLMGIADRLSESHSSFEEFRNEITILKQYEDSVESFVRVMEDLRLVSIMNQCVDVVYKDKERPVPKPPPPPGDEDEDDDYDKDDSNSSYHEKESKPKSKRGSRKKIHDVDDNDHEDDHHDEDNDGDEDGDNGKTEKKKKKKDGKAKEKSKRNLVETTSLSSPKKKKKSKKKKAGKKMDNGDDGSESSEDTTEVLADARGIGDRKTNSKSLSTSEGTVPSKPKSFKSKKKEKTKKKDKTKKSKKKTTKKGAKKGDNALEDGDREIDNDDGGPSTPRRRTRDEEDESSTTSDSSSDDNEDDEEGQGGPPQESEFLLYFDPKTNAIGRIDRKEAISKSGDLLVDPSKEGDKNGAYAGEEYRNVIRDQSEKDEIFFLLKKLERRKPEESSWLDEIKKEKTAAAAKDDHNKNKKVYKSTALISRRNSIQSPTGKKAKVGSSSPATKPPLRSPTQGKRPAVRDYRDQYKQIADKPGTDGWSKVSSRNLQ